MIKILHLYYDLLNLYGENANTRCLVHSLELNKIKTQVDLKSINDKIDFNNYDIIYIGEGSEDNLLLALDDLLDRKKEIKNYIESGKCLILTGNSMDLFGKYIEIKNEKIDSLNIFDYYTKFINETTFKNASTDRIVGEVNGSTSLIEQKVIGFQNRCDLNYEITTPLLNVPERFSNDLTSNDEGFTYKNVYATHMIGPLLIRNPYLTDYILNRVCKDKKIIYKVSDEDSVKAYKKYLSNFNIN